MSQTRHFYDPVEVEAQAKQIRDFYTGMAATAEDPVAKISYELLAGLAPIITATTTKYCEHPKEFLTGLEFALASIAFNTAGNAVMEPAIQGAASILQGAADFLPVLARQSKDPTVHEVPAIQAKETVGNA